jgi:hypothetical protein
VQNNCCDYVGLGDKEIVFRLPEDESDISLVQNVQTGNGVHPPSYSIGIGGSFNGYKAAGA